MSHLSEMIIAWRIRIAIAHLSAGTLRHIVLHYTILHYTALHCTAPHCATSHYSTLL